MADNLPPLFGRSMFDRRPNEEAITIDALLGDEPKERPQFTMPPFRKGQLVRQSHGPGVESNQRCVVSDIKFLNNVSGFSGWAIKLDGRTKPYEASMFQAIVEPSRAGDPYDVNGPDPDTRVIHDVRTRTYCTIIGDVTIVLMADEVEGVPLQAIRDALLQRVPNLRDTVRNRVVLQLLRASMTAEQFAAAAFGEPEMTPPPANGKRRRIVRPGEQG